MKPEEALNDLKLETFVIDNMICYNKDFEPKNDCESLVRRKDALATAINSLDKQIPKKPTMEYFEEYESEYLCCPNCKKILTDRIPGDPKTFYFHCLNCGQKLDWN